MAETVENDRIWLSGPGRAGRSTARRREDTRNAAVIRADMDRGRVRIRMHGGDCEIFSAQPASTPKVAYLVGRDPVETN